MPITFAHPAILFPFKYLPRKWYSWTGLVIGSMVPDFEAFVNLGGEKKLSHSWVGMFTYDLPLGLLLTFIFHAVVKYALVANVPGFLKARFAVYSRLNWKDYFTRRFFVVLICMLIGIASHLLWDRITHTDTYTYTEKAGIYLTDYQSAKLQEWLQWGCSIAGMLIIAWQVWLLPVFKKNAPKAWWPFWPTVFVVCGIVYRVRHSFVHWGDDMVNTAIGGFIFGVIIASSCYRVKYRDRTTR